MHVCKASKAEPDYTFNYGENVILKTQMYRYLGFNINSNNDIGKMVEGLINSSSRALSSITSKFYKLDGLDYSSFKTLYDAVVQPVMNYSAAILGMNKYSKCDTIQNRAIHTILGVGRVTPTAAMYGDLDWVLPYIKQRGEVIKFWFRVSKMSENRLTKKIFHHDQELANRGRVSHGHEVKLILESAGLDIWETQGANSDRNHIVKSVHDSDIASFQDKLRSDSASMSRLNLYNNINNGFALKDYITLVNSRKHRSLLAKSRMGTFPVREETGRYRGVARDERLCIYCDMEMVEDIIHVVRHCPRYNEIRTTFYDSILPSGTVFNDIEFMQFCLCSDKLSTMTATANFLYNVLIIRSNSAP